MDRLKRFWLAVAVVALAGCATTRPSSDTAAERERAATLVLLCADVMDLRRLQMADPDAEPVPPKWSHFAAKEDGGTWEIVGYLSAMDSIELFGEIPVAKPKRVLYGVLAREIANPERYALAIRGTRSALEWAKDAEVTLDPSPWGPGAMVHHGFYSTYDSMRYQPKGQPLDERPAWAAVRDAVQGRPVTVAGHSLGAPLAIYLSLDMARAEQPVAGRYFAAPRAGNTALADEVNRRVPDHLVFNNELDVVPYLPPRSDSYQPLANVALLPPRNDVLKIGDDIVCYHHAISYAALLQPALMSVDQWKQRLERSRQQAKCILAGAPA